MVADRADREGDRSKEIDAKATALLAGIVAFIGFSFRTQMTPSSAITALLYCIPLAFLLRVFMSAREAIAPSPESLVTFFPEYPTATLRKAVFAMERSCRSSERVNDQKMRRLESATLLMAGTTICVLVVQLVVALR